MFPTVPSYPAYTYMALGVLWLFGLGALVVLLIGMVRGLLYVLSGAARTVTTVIQWLCGLPMISSAGSAHFASRREVKAAGLLAADGVPLAAYGQADTLREPTGGHVLVMGPPRSWKSTLLMEALRQFPGSCVTNDLRGELHARTGEQRATYEPVYRFAPTSAEICGVNILDLVRWNSPYQHGDVARIVHHLLSPPERLSPPNPFAGAALPVLTAIVVHCHDLGQAHFPGVVAWMLANRPLKEKVAELLASSNPLVVTGARRLADQSERLRSATWNAALEPLAVFEDETVAPATRPTAM